MYAWEYKDIWRIRLAVGGHDGPSALVSTALNGEPS